MLLLPDEILLEIFNVVELDSPGNETYHQDLSSPSDIAALRLVSRRFNDLSTPLLVHRSVRSIRLKGIDAHCLETLEIISQNSLFRQRVQTIRFEMCGYVPRIVTSPRTAGLASLAGHKVLKKALAYRQAYLTEAAAEVLKDGYDRDELERKRVEVAGVLERVQAVLETWNSIIEGRYYDCDSENDTDREQEAPEAKRRRAEEPESSKLARRKERVDARQQHIHLLDTAQSLYQQRYEDQQSLSQEDFVERLKKALSRFPTALHLEVQDFHSETCEAPKSIPCVKDTDQFAGLFAIDSLIEPTSRPDMKLDPIEMELNQLGLTLPILFHEAGCKLESVSVVPRGIPVGGTGRDDFVKTICETFRSTGFKPLSDAVQAAGLKSFTFAPRQPLSTKKESLMSKTHPDVCEAFQKYIAAMTNTSSLERVKMQWHNVSYENDSSRQVEVDLDVGRAILRNVLRSPVIQEVHLVDFDIRKLDIQEFLQAVEEQNIHFRRLTLERPTISGPWAWGETLDKKRRTESSQRKQIPEVRIIGKTWVTRQARMIEQRLDDILNGGLGRSY